MKRRGVADSQALVVLGKTLQQGKISCEFAGRLLSAMAYLTANEGRYGHLFFVGGRGEAHAAAGWFVRRYGSRFADMMVHTEARSTTTVENIGYLTGQLNRHNIARVDLLSSDYHMARLLAVQTHLPGQSLLQPLGSRRGALLGVPYCFDRLGDADQRQLAAIYRCADQLNLPRIYLEAALAGAAAPSWPWASAQLADIAARLETNLPVSVSSARLAAVISASAELTGLAKRWDSDVAGVGGWLGTLKARLDQLIGRLRGASDQDRPATAADWSAIARCAIGVEALEGDSRWVGGKPGRAGNRRPFTT